MLNTATRLCSARPLEFVFVLNYLESISKYSKTITKITQSHTTILNKNRTRQNHSECRNRVITVNVRMSLLKSIALI